MKFTIRPDYSVTWFKRRDPTLNQPKAIEVSVQGLELKKGHICAMIAKYDDGEVYFLGAQVLHNEIKDTWSVQGLDAHGHSVVADISDI